MVAQLYARPTYRYLREPLLLPYGETIFLKWGSNVVSLKAKRSIRHRLSNLVGRRATVGRVVRSCILHPLAPTISTLLLCTLFFLNSLPARGS